MLYCILIECYVEYYLIEYTIANKISYNRVQCRYDFVYFFRFFSFFAVGY